MKIKMKLNSASVEQALAQVNKYEQGLEEKTERLRRRVAEELYDLCKEGFNGSVYAPLLCTYGLCA